ncbi:MAG: hypothetical protein GWO20_20265, partial [Candidatus Korarchaeota archaeon]|nr:hypothetical protein [Candidatus Korarchaeota archaeon]NIW15671.1 hypothetical protein [Candidatus Thorarchaeota archaeon]
SLERSIEPYAKPSSLDRKVSTKAHPEEQPSESSREFVVKDAAAGEEAQPTSQVLEFYVNEAREQLEDINYLLLKLEKSPENEELQHHLMRCMHTLKGSSGMVNAKQIEALSHRCEEVLDNNLKGEKSLSPELFDLLFEVVDEINYVLNKFEKAGREETHNIENILDKIYKYSEAAIVSEPKREEKERREEPSSKTAKLTKAEEEKEAEKRDTYLRLNIKKMDHLLNLAAELVISNNQFKTQLDRLKNYIPILNKNLKVFRDTEDFMDTLLREGKHLEAELKSYVEDKPGAQEAFRKLSDHLQRALKNVQALQDEVTSVGHNLKENSKTYDENLQKVNKLSNELLDEVMQARLVPINMLFQRFHRPIRDLARQLQKQIRLSLKGEETELDRTLVEELYEPLLHIIRNAIDHGLESGEDRKAAGKDPEGRIEVKAYRDRNQVIIEISD